MMKIALFNNMVVDVKMWKWVQEFVIVPAIQYVPVIINDDLKLRSRHDEDGQEVSNFMIQNQEHQLNYRK